MEERDTFAICLSMFVDGRKAWRGWPVIFADVLKGRSKC